VVGVGGGVVADVEVVVELGALLVVAEPPGAALVVGAAFVDVLAGGATEGGGAVLGGGGELGGAVLGGGAVVDGAVLVGKTVGSVAALP
jgi:hypothetical protein